MLDTGSTSLQLDPSVRIVRCTTTEHLVRKVKQIVPDVVVIKADGSVHPQPDLVASIRTMQPRIPVYVVYDTPDPGLAARFIRAGATDVLPIANAVIDLFPPSEPQHRPAPASFKSILTCDDSLLSVLEHAADAARARYPILITGETGTGKDLLTRAIHTASGRRGRLVVENVAGLNDDLLSDTLFGHRRGAFTGAGQDRAGLVRRADGGTLFLDEIGDLSSRSQVKLLRLIEKGEFYPLGSAEPVRCDVRFVAATNRDLSAMVRDEVFRSDLYYRLSFHAIHLPPLRERTADIPILAEHFVRNTAQRLGKPVPEIPPETMAYLKSQQYPGNVRELRSQIINAVVMCPGTVLLPIYFSDPRDFFQMTHPMPAVPATNQDGVTFPEELPEMDELNRQLVEEALRRTEGNQSAAAQLLGISPSAVNKRVHRGALGARL